MKIIAERYHDISCGHRVVGHENKCRHLHGHNYRIHFSIEAEELDKVGRVMDFSVIKAKLCQWLEDCFDHKVVDYIAKIRFFQLITTGLCYRAGKD
jgi:6-pyruvoyltetrahydropterin/6-carboxytetrahydropterin synthase